MKAFLRFLVVLIFVSIASSSQACEIEIKLIGDQKEQYEQGDELLINVLVVLTHKICPIGIMATEFELTGLEIVKEEEWVGISDRIYTKDIRLKVTGSEKGIIKISGKRTCEKDGGFGELTIQGATEEDQPE